MSNFGLYDAPPNALLIDQTTYPPLDGNYQAFHHQPYPEPLAWQHGQPVPYPDQPGQDWFTAPAPPEGFYPPPLQHPQQMPQYAVPELEAAPQQNAGRQLRSHAVSGSQGGRQV